MTQNINPVDHNQQNIDNIRTMVTGSSVRASKEVKEPRTKDKQVESKGSLLVSLPVVCITVIVDTYDKVHFEVQLPNLPEDRRCVSAQINFPSGESFKYVADNFPHVPLHVVKIAKRIHFQKAK